jgi:serine/threonine-protein kinase
MTVTHRHPPGARFGSHEIVRFLGAGGMGSVYEAKNTALGKRVAIKILHEHLAGDAVAAARFLQEGRAASAIRHPNVVQVFEVGSYGGAPYLVMDLLEGEDLATYLRPRGRLSASEAVDLLLPAVSAVAAAHAAGVVHRDLKPKNILLVREQRTRLRAQVVDFGISKMARAEGEARLTETAALLGTLDYMAPEQARSARNADERSDQYALGVIAYECLTGRKPFSADGTYELLHAIVTASVQAPRSLGVDIPAELESAILRAMSRDRAGRFPSVESFGHALLPFASEASRAWWCDEFGAAGATSSPGAHASAAAVDAAKSGREDAESLIGATVPERPSRRQGPRPSRRGITNALAIAALAGVAAMGAFWASKSSSTIHEQGSGRQATGSGENALFPEPVARSPEPIRERRWEGRTEGPSQERGPVPTPRAEGSPPAPPASSPPARSARTARPTGHANATPTPPVNSGAPAPTASASAPPGSFPLFFPVTDK